MLDNFFTTAGEFDAVWMVVSIVLAIVGGIAIYFLFVAKENEYKENAMISFFHNFLNFKKFFIEGLLKVAYIICAIYVTLNSFSYIGYSFARFVSMLVFGNLLARICFELVMMLITLVSNTTAINQKLTDLGKISATKTKKKSEEDNKNA